jgi:hypothetical protein
MDEFQQMKDRGYIDDVPAPPKVTFDPVTKTIHAELAVPPGYMWATDAETGELCCVKIPKMGILVRQTVRE